MRFPQRLHFVFLLSATLFTLQAEGGQSRYTGSSRLLEVPCVGLYRNGLAVEANNQHKQYEVEMQLEKGQLKLTKALLIDARQDCGARYDTASGLYTDIVRIGDRLFDVVLTHLGDMVFSLDSYDFKERAPTSLWRVSDGVNEVFIGGAVHILHEDDYPLPAAYEEAYELADIVVLEVDLDDDAQDIPLEELLAQITNPDASLSEVLRPDVYQSLSDFLAQHGLPIAVMENWYVQIVVQLVQDLVFQNEGFTQPGVDLFFGSLAIDDGKDQRGLETVISQSGVITNLFKGLENEVVQEVLFLAQQGLLTQGLAPLIRAWREGDVDYVYDNVVLPQKLLAPADYDALMVQRNLNWLPQIEAMFETPELELVLVGLAHLVGEDSVFALLEEAGYSIERY